MLKGDGNGGVSEAEAGVDFAPAGCGLGIRGKTLTADDDLDNIYDRSGWYYWGAEIPANAPTLISYISNPAFCSMLLIGMNQIVFSYNDRGSIAIRTRASDEWGLWEYSNPVMTPGVEYRTTERWKRKAIYKKLDTDNIIKWRIDGETEWKPEILYTGGISQDISNALTSTSFLSTTVTLEPTELVSYLNALPRFLSRNQVIKIKAGTVPDTVVLNYFYGFGNITFMRAEDGEVIFSKGVDSDDCKVEVYFENISFTGVAIETATYRSRTSNMATFSGCSFTNDSARFGAYIQASSNCYFVDTSFTGYEIAVDAIGTSIVSLQDCSGSNNTYGVTVWGGGIVLLGGSTPNTLGGGSNSRSGGIIVLPDGTLC